MIRGKLGIPLQDMGFPGRLTKGSSQQTWPAVSRHSGLSKYSSPGDELF